MPEPTMTVTDEEAEASARGDVARRGRALYDAKLKAVLEPEYGLTARILMADMMAGKPDTRPCHKWHG